MLEGEPGGFATLEEDGDLAGELTGDLRAGDLVVVDLDVAGDFAGDFEDDGFSEEVEGDFNVDLTDDVEGEGDKVWDDVAFFMLEEEGSFCLYANNDSLGLGGGAESFLRALLKY